MAAWLMLSLGGNEYTVAEDKTFTLLFRHRLFFCLLSAYICYDPFCYTKRSLSYCLLKLHHVCSCIIFCWELEELKCCSVFHLCYTRQVFFFITRPIKCHSFYEELHRLHATIQQLFCLELNTMHCGQSSYLLPALRLFTVVHTTITKCFATCCQAAESCIFLC